MKRTIKTTAMSLDPKTSLPVLLKGIEVLVDTEAQQLAVIRKGEAPLVLSLPELFPAEAEAAKDGEERKPRAAKAAKEEPAEEAKQGELKHAAPSAGKTVKAKAGKGGGCEHTIHYSKDNSDHRCVLPAGHEGRHSYKAS